MNEEVLRGWLAYAAPILTGWFTIMELVSFAMIDRDRTYWPALKVQKLMMGTGFGTFAGALWGRWWSEDFRIPPSIWLLILGFLAVGSTYTTGLIWWRNRHPSYLVIDVRGVARRVTGGELENAAHIVAAALAADVLDDHKVALVRESFVRAKLAKRKKQPGRSEVIE